MMPERASVPICFLKPITSNQNLWPNILIVKENAKRTRLIDQLSAIGTVQMPLKGDFLVNGKYLFEVGGESKEFDQIAGIETGYGARIPLWMFGLLY